MQTASQKRFYIIALVYTKKPHIARVLLIKYKLKFAIICTKIVTKSCNQNRAECNQNRAKRNQNRASKNL